MFNEDMSCIAHFVFLHVILRKPQILLTFSRHQLMYNVSYVVLCAEVTYKGHFGIQKQSKEQNETLITASIISDFCFLPELATIIFILFSLTCLLCCVALT